MITLSQAIINRIRAKTQAIRVSDVFVMQNPDGKTVHVELRIGPNRNKVEQDVSLMGDLSENVDDFISDVISEYYHPKNPSR